MKLALSYMIFAAVATLANIGSQEISIHIYSGIYGIFLSVMVGTAVGLITKYLLDKRFIFRYRTRDIGHGTRIFTLYSMTGVLTTLIFWGFEFSFAYLFPSRIMRYVGGVTGLAIGYTIKYRLDKRYVFTGGI